MQRSRFKWAAARLGQAAEAHALRSTVAIALAQLAGFIISDPSRFGRVVGFVVTNLAVATVILLLLSLSDDDRRLHRLAERARGLSRPGPMPARTDDRAGLRTLERDVESVAELTRTIEQRLLHRHPVSGLPTREPLFDRIAQAGARDEYGLLGVIHLHDLDRLRGDSVERSSVNITGISRAI